MIILNKFISYCIVLSVGYEIQREIIRNNPQMRKEIERSQRRALFMSIIVTAIIGLALYLTRVGIK